MLVRDSDKVYFTGYVERDDLPLIYNLAEVFIYPSAYEALRYPFWKPWPVVLQLLVRMFHRCPRY